MVQEFARISDYIQLKFLKQAKITKQSKDWWNKECQAKLLNYRSSKQVKYQKTFKCVVKKTKQSFFDNKIQEIASKNYRLWNLMN